MRSGRLRRRQRHHERDELQFLRTSSTDPKYKFGPSGPGLSVHHLVAADLIQQGAIHTVSAPTAQPEHVTLRPTIQTASPGSAALRIGSLLAEFRHKGSWVGTTFVPDGWDRALGIGDSPGCVLIYDLNVASPVIQLATNGHEALVAGDRFESRVGLGDVSIYVSSIDDDGGHADLEVELRPVQVNAWQRWLVLPCAYPDQPAASKNSGDLSKILQGAERFYQEMAQTAFPTGGGFVLSGQGNKGGEWIPLFNGKDLEGWTPKITGRELTAKDFRTWAGTVLATMALKELEPFENESQGKKNVKLAISAVAKILGNTPAICRKCYVHPAVLETYLDGTLIAGLKSQTEQALVHSSAGLRAEEFALLSFLQRRLSQKEIPPTKV